MKVNKHICFGREKCPALYAYLYHENIPHENPFSSTIVLDILDDDPHWPAVSAFVEQHGLLCLSETSFTKKELAQAEWLTVRSKWHNGYPLPDGDRGYLRITYRSDDCCAECGVGLRQQAPFRLAAAPKWGSRHFMMLNWVFDELFVDDVARSVLESSGLTGFRFLPVHDRRGNGALPGVHQLVVEELSRPGLISEGVTGIDQVHRCSICGIPKYHPTGIGMQVFARNALQDMPAICRSHEHFGWGCGADRKILIRQDMYQHIVSSHLERSLVFEPVELR